MVEAKQDTMSFTFDGRDGNCYRSEVKGADETVMATYPLSLTRMTEADGINGNDAIFSTEEEKQKAMILLYGETESAQRDLLTNQFGQGKVTGIALCISNKGRENMGYKYVEKQFFLKWFGEAIDRVHDIDEYKSWFLSPSVLYDRWVAELSMVPSDKLDNYLKQIDTFYKTKLVKQTGLFGFMGSGHHPLTFYEWWQLGGPPALMKSEDYKLPKITVRNVKAAMVTGLVEWMNEKGCGFIRPLQQPTAPEIGDYVMATPELITLNESKTCGSV